MHRRRETSIAERKSIMALTSTSISTQVISRILNINSRKIQRWKKRHQETENFENKPRCGALRRTTIEEHHRIIETARTNPITTAVNIKTQIEVNLGVQTVRKRLHDVELHHRTLATKPFLTDAYREQRLVSPLQYFFFFNYGLQHLQAIMKPAGLAQPILSAGI